MPARPRQNRTPDGAKKRWSADDRARRTSPSTGSGGPARSGRSAAAFGSGSRADRREARFGAESAGADTRSDARVDWYPGARTGRKRPADGDARARRPWEATGAERPARRRNDADEAPRAPRQERPGRPARDALPTRRPERGPERGGRRPERTDRRPERTERRPERGPDRTGRRPAASVDRAPHWEAPEDVVLERLQADVVTAEEVAGSTFAALGLGEQITKALGELGAAEPFPIQAATIPPAVAGRDVLGRGRTGSGKTIAFGAALVERLMRTWAEAGRTGTGRRMGRPPRALILAPTRELALQIDRTVQPIARSVGLFTTQIVGGVPQGRQVGALAKGVDIVIGTPGRIEDLLEQRRLDLGDVEIAVLDEADHMAELGFLEPMQRLLRRIPAGGQRLMFSATLDSAVSQLVDEFLTDPSVHEVADPEGSGTSDHRVLVVDQGAKLAVLTALIGSAERSLVFARTRAFAEQLADDLDEAGVKAESLHGDLNQARRTRNLARFSEGRVAALVATDVAARGIHVDDIELVIHADAAEDYKSYLHRSGRTGRAGASGTVVTLINPRRRRRMTELLERAGIQAEFAVLGSGDDPVAAIGR